MLTRRDVRALLIGVALLLASLLIYSFR